MSLGLHNLQINFGAKKRKRNRVGRGNSSGHGTYSTRGIKGQKARSGSRFGLKKLGMKMMIQRLPKFKGMKSLHLEKQIVNLAVLSKFFKEGEVVNKKTLFAKKLISSMRLPFKILGKGEITKKLQIETYEVSTTARAAIEKAGGKISLIKK